MLSLSLMLNIVELHGFHKSALCLQVFLLSHNLREGQERMKLSNQQDKASPRPQAACLRAGTGRRSNSLLAAIKSLAADIAAIKMAVAPDDGDQQFRVSHHPGPGHLALATAAATTAKQWRGISQSKMAQMGAKTTGIVPLLQQGRRPPTHSPYAPTSLEHRELDDMHARTAEQEPPNPAQPAREKISFSRSRSAASTYLVDEALAPADSAWRSGAPATAPPMPPEWGIPSRVEGGNGAAHTSSQAEEWGGVVLVPGRGRLPPFFTHDIRQAGRICQQAQSPQHAGGRTVSWAVALEAELDSDLNCAALTYTC
jgi:hypothetical protein